MDAIVRFVDAGACESGLSFSPSAGQYASCDPTHPALQVLKVEYLVCGPVC